VINQDAREGVFHKNGAFVINRSTGGTSAATEVAERRVKEHQPWR